LCENTKGKAKKENTRGEEEIVFYRDKKTGYSFFAFPLLSGKFGKQSLRIRATIYFFFGITGFFVPEWKTGAHMGLGRQFSASLKSVQRHS
jgi:hypothetical protein